jgi:3-hydroxyisobutyrate dehydrogenase
MAKVAFIGLGNMGRGMAGCLVKAGHEVAVWNRSPGKADALVATGAREAASPREACEGVDAVFSMVGDDAASRAVWLGADGALAGAYAAGAFAIECSTLSYGWVLELAEAAKAAGLRYIDCPVTGLPDAAAAGELVLLAGADKDDMAAARPFLDAVSKETFLFGPVGAGTAYKLLINLMGAVQIAGAAEGLVMAEKAGLDLDMVREAIGIGQAASPQVVRNVARMVAGDHDDPVVFSGTLRLKDTLYGVDLARHFGIDAAFGETAARAYRTLVEGGGGEVNESKVFDAMRKAWLKSP